MRYCTNCGKEVSSDAKFCNSCGAQLGLPDVDPQEFFKSNNKTIYASVTDPLSKYTGENSEVDVDLKALFSEVPKRHTKDEAENIFISGTKTTTPTLDQVSDDWAKPWLFSRILVGFLLAFIALLYMAVEFKNNKAIPGLILVGAFAVPFSGLVFFFETNAFKNISLFQIVKIFFIGGIFSLVVTVFLYQFVHFSVQNQMLGTITFNDSLSIGFVEELGKALIISYFISNLNTKYILNGLLIGAAVGAGFAAFETAGYIYNAGNSLVNVAILRGWSALGGHLVWAAIIGGALMLVKQNRPFKFSQMLDTRFLVFFAIAVLLHAAWDWDIPMFNHPYLKIVILIIIAWGVVFVLMNAGLKEITHLKQKQ